MPVAAARWTDARASSKLRSSFCVLAALSLLSLTQCGRKTNPGPDQDAAGRAMQAALDAARPEARGKPGPPYGAGLKGATPSDASGASPAGFPALPQKAREFGALSEEERKAFGRLQDEFWRTQDQGRRGEILDEIEASYYGEEVLALAERIIGLGDEALRLRAIEMLAGNTSAAMIPMLEKVLHDPSEQVRWNAVTAVAQVRDDAVIGYLGKVFDDESANVRLTGLNVLDDQTEERRLKILGRALEAPHPDVQNTAIGTLQTEWTSRSVEVLFSALDSSDPEVRDQARFSIDFMIDQEFTGAAAARAWWKENKNKFTGDLQPQE